MVPSPFLRLAMMTSVLGLTACGTAHGTAPLAGTQECTGCHGDAARAGTALQQAAPPRDAHGRTATSEVTVGAHQAHLDGGVACATCHAIPAQGDLLHAIAPYATVIFSGNVVGAAGTPVAPWNRDQPTCANYCHSATGRGGTTPNPAWNTTTPLGCGACHWDQQTSATNTGLHKYHVMDLPAATRLDCGACHGAGYSTAGVTGAATTTHADGAFQITANVGWQDPRCTGPRTCYASCHTSVNCRAWP
jgi:predicted CxxxxCH...CXXCH cytochrome family protein